MNELITDPGLRNWIKACLGLKCVRDGMLPFMTRKCEDLYSNNETFTKTITKLTTYSCNMCCVKDVQPNHARINCPANKRRLGRNTNCACRSPSKNKTLCPTGGACGVMYDRIMEDHVNMTPRWDNSDCQKWYLNGWEQMKCFIDIPGYKEKALISQADVTAFVHICQNNKTLCTIFNSHLGKLMQVRSDRNEIYHSGDMVVTDDKLKEYFANMQAVLKIVVFKAFTPDTQEQLDKLAKLEADVGIEVNTVTEIEARKETLNALIEDTRTLEERNANTPDDNPKASIKQQAQYAVLQGIHMRSIADHLKRIKEEFNLCAKVLLEQSSDLKSITAGVHANAKAFETLQKELVQQSELIRGIEVTTVDTNIVVAKSYRTLKDVECGVKTVLSDVKTVLHICKEIQKDIKHDARNINGTVVAEIKGASNENHLSNEIVQAIRSRKFNPDQEANGEIDSVVMDVVNAVEADGDEIIDVLPGSIIIKIKCLSMSNWINMCEQCIDGRMTQRFKPLQDHLRKNTSSGNLTITVDMLETDFIKSVDTIVKQLYSHMIAVLPHNLAMHRQDGNEHSNVQDLNAMLKRLLEKSYQSFHQIPCSDIQIPRAQRIEIPEMQIDSGQTTLVSVDHTCMKTKTDQHETPATSETLSVQTTFTGTHTECQVIKGRQVIESATMEGHDALTSATEAGVAEFNVTLIKGQQVIESTTIEGHDALTSATEAGVKGVTATVTKGQQALESVTIDGRNCINLAIEAGARELTAQTFIGKQDIESAVITGMDIVDSATVPSAPELSTHLRELQSIGNEIKTDLLGIKTQQGDENFALQCNDLLSRLMDHYSDSVICVPLTTLDPSLDRRVQDIYANPKIHKMKIEKDGKHVKKKQIYKYRDVFCGGFRRIYLQGEPGSGKSYFAAKLVHDWCIAHAPIVKSTKKQRMFGDVDTLQKFRFLFFISLRDSREQTHVTHMIKTQLIYKIYDEDEWENAYKLVLKIMKNVMYLIIQDGLDEWPCREALPSMDGIPKDQCTVLTTSRPWKLADERIRNSQIDILLDLEGISDPTEFNETILRCLLDESTDIETSVKLFEQFLRSHNLESISSSPMLNTLVLCTWVDDRAERLTGSSLCELYTTMLENLCKKANSQIGYFDHQSTVYCFSGTKYVKPNITNIDSIAKAAFSFLFSNEKESSLVFSDIDLTAHLSETAKQFALDSGLLSKRKGKKCTDQTVSFVHKTIQEFLTAFHIHRNADVIDDVISGYLKRHDNSYRDISQIFIFLCGFNISAANKLSTLMNELDVNRGSHYDFQNCILSGYREAVANKNTPIHLHLSHFYFDSDNDAEDLIQIWALNTSRARSLCVKDIKDIHVAIRSQDASSSRCEGPGPVALPAHKDHGVSTRDDEEQFRSSESGIEIDLSSCHNLERLQLGRFRSQNNNNITVQPHALMGLKKLTHLEIYCKYEALDLSHYEHIQSIQLNHKVTLLPLSLNNYKTLQSIVMHTTYDGLDLSMFENLNSLTISNNVNVLPKPLLIHNKLTDIELHEFDSNTVDNNAVNTWCLLNGADPVTCADYTPVLPSIKHIRLHKVTCPSTWLRSLLTTMLTIDHEVKCIMKGCIITALNHEVEDADSESFRTKIITNVNNTCTFDVESVSPGIWETLLFLNVKHLSLRCWFGSFEHVSSLSRSLASLSQLETLTLHLSEYIDLQPPPSIKYLTVCYDSLFPKELRCLVKKLSACTQSLECRLEFICGEIHFDDDDDECMINKIPPEEYVPIQQELEALEHVEVKQFRIYDRTPNTDKSSSAAWSVRDSVDDDGDYVNNIINDEWFKSFLKWNDSDGTNRISIGLQIN